MHAVLLSTLLHTLGAADPVSVLVMPLAAKTASLDGLAEQLTDVFTAEAAQVPGFRIVSVAEVQGAMTQEQMKQLAACDAISCAAEIGGSLNTEQVVIGSLGRVGDEFLLTITRIQSKDATALTRLVERIPVEPETELLDRLSEITPKVFGRPEVKKERKVRAKRARAEKKDSQREITVEMKSESGGSIFPWIVRSLGIVGLAATLVPVVASAILGGIVLVVMGMDGGPKPPGSTHNINFPTAVAGDLSGFGAIVFGLLALGGLAISGALIVLSMVMP